MVSLEETKTECSIKCMDAIPLGHMAGLLGLQSSLEWRKEFMANGELEEVTVNREIEHIQLPNVAFWTYEVKADNWRKSDPLRSQFMSALDNLLPICIKHVRGTASDSEIAVCVEIMAIDYPGHVNLCVLDGGCFRKPKEELSYQLIIPLTTSGMVIRYALVPDEFSKLLGKKEKGRVYEGNTNACVRHLHIPFGKAVLLREDLFKGGMYGDPGELWVEVTIGVTGIEYTADPRTLEHAAMELIPNEKRRAIFLKELTTSNRSFNVREHRKCETSILDDGYQTALFDAYPTSDIVPSGIYQPCSYWGEDFLKDESAKYLDFLEVEVITEGEEGLFLWGMGRDRRGSQVDMIGDGNCLQYSLILEKKRWGLDDGVPTSKEGAIELRKRMRRYAEDNMEKISELCGGEEKNPFVPGCDDVYRENLDSIFSKDVDYDNIREDKNYHCEIQPTVLAFLAMYREEMPLRVVTFTIDKASKDVLLARNEKEDLLDDQQDEEILQGMLLLTKNEANREAGGSMKVGSRPKRDAGGSKNINEKKGKISVAAKMGGGDDKGYEHGVEEDQRKEKETRVEKGKDGEKVDGDEVIVDEDDGSQKYEKGDIKKMTKPENGQSKPGNPVEKMNFGGKHGDPFAGLVEQTGWGWKKEETKIVDPDNGQSKPGNPVEKMNFCATRVNPFAGLDGQNGWGWKNEETKKSMDETIELKDSAVEMAVGEPAKVETKKSTDKTIELKDSAVEKAVGEAAKVETKKSTDKTIELKDSAVEKPVGEPAKELAFPERLVGNKFEKRYRDAFNEIPVVVPNELIGGPYEEKYRGLIGLDPIWNKNDMGLSRVLNVEYSREKKREQIMKKATAALEPEIGNDDASKEEGDDETKEDKAIKMVNKKDKGLKDQTEGNMKEKESKKDESTDTVMEPMVKKKKKKVKTLKERRHENDEGNKKEETVTEIEPKMMMTDYDMRSGVRLDHSFCYFPLGERKLFDYYRTIVLLCDGEHVSIYRP